MVLVFITFNCPYYYSGCDDPINVFVTSIVILMFIITTMTTVLIIATVVSIFNIS